MLENACCAVAGASGFLGRRVAELLLLRGADVRAIVRTSSQVAPIDTLRVFALDLDDADALTTALQGVTVLFNCIGHSSDWGPWSEFVDGNVDSVERLWRAAAAAGVKRIVHVSTTDVYGYPKAPCDERHMLTDVGLPYNRSKILGEALARRLAAELGLAVTIVRPATIFGPRSHDWVVELSRELRARRVPTLDGGHTHAGLVFVDDVADSLIGLAERSETVGEAYNVVDPQPIEWRRYFAELCETLNVRGPNIDIPSPLALAAARASEAAARLLRSKRRPLFTRHIALVMSRDQHYASAKLCRVLPEYPRVGLQRGLALTKTWLIHHSALD
ncbi:NAD-dependent epimerase/dehydratase family protein [Burkholderia sp. BCC0405]|uniref:NAD-dependent epimerase/dehydratase family protein n=1 Tax=Burkholderia sp. BCC0405 TaxID=2676298 RepID=UPI00158B0CA4|nr:NAD-dependent epimerase/dehydratase family protein [Burkholderia sp. BCC0405]